jgi:hypothetical protein
MPPTYNPYNGSKIKKYALSLLSIYDLDKFGKKLINYDINTNNHMTVENTNINIENNDQKTEKMEINIINTDTNPGTDISENMDKSEDIFDEQIFSLSQYEDNSVLTRDEIPCDDFVLWRRQVYIYICLYMYMYIHI